MRFSFEWNKYALVIWGVNVLTVVLSYWTPLAMIAFVPLFIALMIGYGALCRFNRHDEVRLDELLKGAKSRIQTAGSLSLLYSGINSWVCLFRLRNGGPHIDDGVYCLWNHGFVREITYEEYGSLLRVESRLFLIILLAFSSLTMMGFDQRNSEGYYPY